MRRRGGSEQIGKPLVFAKRVGSGTSESARRHVWLCSTSPCIRMVARPDQRETQLSIGFDGKAERRQNFYEGTNGTWGGSAREVSGIGHIQSSNGLAEVPRDDQGE